MWLDIRRPQGNVSSSFALDFVARIHLSGDQMLAVTTIGRYSSLPRRLESLISVKGGAKTYQWGGVKVYHPAHCSA